MDEQQRAEEAREFLVRRARQRYWNGELTAEEYYDLVHGDTYRRATVEKRE